VPTLPPPLLLDPPPPPPPPGAPPPPPRCRLLPHVEKIVRVAADPELREVATKALVILERVSREGQEAAAQPANNKVDWQVRLQLAG